MNEVQGLVDGLAERLARPVGLDDRRFGAVAYSSHDDDIDAVRRRSILGRQAPPAVVAWLNDLGLRRADGPVHVPANAGLDMVARVCVPVRFHDKLLGFLWLIEGEALDDAELTLAVSCADELARALYVERQREREERRREVAGVRALLGGGDGAADEDALRLATGACYAVVELALTTTDDTPPGAGAEPRLTEALDRARRALAPRHQLAEQRDGGATVVVAVDDAEAVARHAALLLEAAAAELADVAGVVVVAGVGAPVDALAALPGAHRQARLAARAAGADRPLVAWHDLGASALVAELLGDRDPAALVPVALRTLLDHPDGTLLTATLEAYLRHAGDARAAAAELFVHRSSLYHRLHRIEELTGTDLRSGSDRLELQLGLALWRLS